jgi:hypothetical protein
MPPAPPVAEITTVAPASVVVVTSVKAASSLAGPMNCPAPDGTGHRLVGILPGMTQPDLEARVAALESQVRELAEQVQHSRQDAAAARVLAGGADRDIEQVRGEIRDFRQATTSSFNAMREDLTDLRTHVDTGFAAVERGFTEMRGKFDAAAAGQQQIAELLSTLIAQREESG